MKPGQSFPLHSDRVTPVEDEVFEAPKPNQRQQQKPASGPITPGRSFEFRSDMDQDQPAPEPKVVLNKQSRLSWLGLLGFSVIGLIVLILLADAFANILWLFQLSPYAGMAGSLLLAFACSALIVLVFKEWRALNQLSKRRHLKSLNTQALVKNDSRLQLRAMRQNLKAGRSNPEASYATQQFRDLVPADAYSPQDQLMLFEREVLGALDRKALALIEVNSRNTAIVTTISPFALFDALFTLWRNLRMVREIAEIYGTAPGFLGSMGLLRKVLANVMLAGGMEAADGVLNQVLGGGLAGRVSAKLGEGLVNGMLSARLGLSAIDECRPMPFNAVKRPSLTEMAKRLVVSVSQSVTGALKPKNKEASELQN